MKCKHRTHVLLLFLAPLFGIGLLALSGNSLKMNHGKSGSERSGKYNTQRCATGSKYEDGKQVHPQNWQAAGDADVFVARDWCVDVASVAADAAWQMQIAKHDNLPVLAFFCFKLRALIPGRRYLSSWVTVPKNRTAEISDLLSLGSFWNGGFIHS